MSRDQHNWTKSATGTYTKTIRGYTGSIVINANGTATLTITGTGAPGPATYDTRRIAMSAFTRFLFAKPVT